MPLRPARRTLVVLALAALGAAGPAAGQRPLTGAGATFPNPIYSRWFDAYARRTGQRINYQSIGSGGGIRQFLEGTVDFGATDGPMTDAQIAQARGNVLHVPTVIGAVAVTYNLPALAGTALRFDAATIAGIYLGRIARWNDRRIAALNPGVRLPPLDIIVIHRSDGSGTTFVFTEYLGKVSPEWRTLVGSATSVRWPVGLGGKGNEGVTQLVRTVEGAIGYVEALYASSNRLPVAAIQNRAGQFTTPGVAALTAAAATPLPPGTDFRVSLTDPAAPEAYPIASFTWLLVRTDNPDATAGRTLRGFLAWMLSGEAQGMARDLGYAPLPAPVVALVRGRIATLTAGGRPL